MTTHTINGVSVGRWAACSFLGFYSIFSVRCRLNRRGSGDGVAKPPPRAVMSRRDINKDRSLAVESQHCKITLPKHFNKPLHCGHSSNCLRIAAEHHGWQGRHNCTYRQSRPPTCPGRQHGPGGFCCPISAPCVAPGWNMGSGVSPALPAPQAWPLCLGKMLSCALPSWLCFIRRTCAPFPLVSH